MTRDRGGTGAAGDKPPAGEPESRRSGGEPATAAERRAQALRDNLRRRKAQARARKAGPSGESPPED